MNDPATLLASLRARGLRLWADPGEGTAGPVTLK
jgi:hypothetical protein